VCGESAAINRAFCRARKVGNDVDSVPEPRGLNIFTVHWIGLSDDISDLRLLAQLVREALPGEKRLAIERSYSLCDTISAHFDKVRALADGVLFEFSASRQHDPGIAQSNPAVATSTAYAFRDTNCVA
jgi:hypothetical protein